MCGCNPMPDEYSFKNANDSIASVEIFHNPNVNSEDTGKPFELICTLDECASKSFMNRVLELKTHLRISPPPTDYGPYFACVTYNDGDIEFFGTWHIEYVECGNTPKKIGAYSFNGDEFEILIKEYIEKYESENQENSSAIPNSTESQETVTQMQ